MYCYIVILRMHINSSIVILVMGNLYLIEVKFHFINIECKLECRVEHSTIYTYLNGKLRLFLVQWGWYDVGLFENFNFSTIFPLC